MLKLTGSIPELSGLLSALGQAGKATREAARDAMRKLRAHVLAVSRKEAAAEADVPEAALKRRWISDPAGPNGLRVWVGTNPIPLDRLGTPKQTKIGVKVGRRPEIPGAFIPKKGGRRKVVFERLGRARLPIRRVPGPYIHEPVERSFAAHKRDFEEFFRKIFYERLNGRMKGR